MMCLPTPQQFLYPWCRSQSWPSTCASKSCVSNDEWCTWNLGPSKKKKQWWSTYSLPRPRRKKTVTFLSLLSGACTSCAYSSQSKCIHASLSPLCLQKSEAKMKVVSYLAGVEVEVARVKLVRLVKVGQAHSKVAQLVHRRGSFRETLLVVDLAVLLRRLHHSR